MSAEKRPFAHRVAFLLGQALFFVFVGVCAMLGMRAVEYLIERPEQRIALYVCESNDAPLEECVRVESKPESKGTSL